MSRFWASASGPPRTSSFRSIGSISATATCCTSPPAARTSARIASNTSASSPKPPTGTGVIDHIGFRTTGLHEMIEHLTKNKINFKERQVNDQGLYQLFLFDPNGVKIELNFANAEAKGRTPQLKATELSPATN